MANFSFWQRWLMIVGILISVFGIVMAFLNRTPLFDFFNAQIDPVFWDATVVGENTRKFQHWIYGVWGATITGWGIFMIFIVHDPFRNQEKWAWNCLAAGGLVWFVLDTSLSIFYKVYFNVAFNAALSLAMILPLIFSRGYFTH